MPHPSHEHLGGAGLNYFPSRETFQGTLAAKLKVITALSHAAGKHLQALGVGDRLMRVRSVETSSQMYTGLEDKELWLHSSVGRESPVMVRKMTVNHGSPLVMESIGLRF